MQPPQLADDLEGEKGRLQPSELRAEHEALSLLHFLRDQGQPQAECLAADQTISEPVCQRPAIRSRVGITLGALAWESGNVR